MLLAMVITSLLRLLEWPGKTAADQQPLAEHLKRQTGTHSAPIKYLRIKGVIEGSIHGYTGILRQGHLETNRQYTISHFSFELAKSFHCTWENKGFSKAKLCLRFRGIRERGWLWVGRGPQPTGQREWGGVGRMLALSAWRTSLRSPCATADSQRIICIIRTLQLQIKKEKQNRKNKQHGRVRGFLLDFHDYCFQILVSFYLIQNWVISIAYCQKCLL